jgi:hypothetical protein
MTFYEEGIVPFIFRVLSYYLVNILYKSSFIVWQKNRGINRGEDQLHDSTVS